MSYEEMVNLIYEGMTKEELKEKSKFKGRDFTVKFLNLVKYGVCYEENGILHLGFRPIKILNNKELISLVKSFK